MARTVSLAIVLVVAIGSSALAQRRGPLFRRVRGAAMAMALVAGMGSPGPQLDQQPFEHEIHAFEGADRAAKPAPGGIVFVGSSSIKLWKTLASDFPDQAVINRGFGGSHIEHSVSYVDRIVVPYAPRAVVLYAGTNDLHAGKSPAAVAEDYKAFVRAVHAKLPEARIIFISVGPSLDRWSEVGKVRELNRVIAEFTATDPRLAFVDVFSRMLGADGRPRPAIYRKDGLHLKGLGYAIWRQEVTPYLAALPASPAP